MTACRDHVGAGGVAYSSIDVPRPDSGVRLSLVERVDRNACAEGVQIKNVHLLVHRDRETFVGAGAVVLLHHLVFAQNDEVSERRQRQVSSDPSLERSRRGVDIDDGDRMP